MNSSTFWNPGDDHELSSGHENFSSSVSEVSTNSELTSNNDAEEPYKIPVVHHAMLREGAPCSGAKGLALTIDSSRLWNAIHHTAQWGAIALSPGMSRLALSDEDKHVRDYFVSEALRIGCNIKVDKMGSIFAILPGESGSVAPIGIGSHLDTQPAGGRFDGILGVLGALEALQTIKESGRQTFAPLAVINWTNEEGARFVPGCSGSSVWAAHTSLSQAHGQYDTASTATMQQELERIGYLGDIPANYEENPLSGHFELHIEQRRLLEDARKKIGIVSNVQGIRWYHVNIQGERAHAGSTPMNQRADALVAAAKMEVYLDSKTREVGAVGTVGVVELDRPSVNTIPGEVKLTIDLRHPCEDILNEFELGLSKYANLLSEENQKIKVNIKKMWHSPAVKFSEEPVSCIRKAARRVVGSDQIMDIVSLAGHDSALTALRVPTAMIFVPSKDGISHAPEEFTSKEDCSLGAQVLLEAVLEFDKALRANHSSQAGDAVCHDL